MGTDLGTRRTVAVRCVEPTEYPEVYFSGVPVVWRGEEGCGWTGSAIAVTEHGAVSLLPEECPSCGGKIEVSEPECSICRRRHKSDDRHPCE